ncbi:MAG: ATP phosphoribosyltransferase regulatory subunit [Anaerolinea sp.]|nr:ATP phosphoribosyltransferase regulatory subunit [Anaerolinea sp.]
MIGDSSIQADVDIMVSAFDCLRLGSVAEVSLIIGSVALMRALLKPFGLDSRTIRFLLARLDDFNDSQRGKAYVATALNHFLGADPTDGRSVAVREIVRYASNERDQSLGGRSPDEIAQRLQEKHRRAQQREQQQAAIDFLERWAKIRSGVDIALAQIEALIPEADGEADRAFDTLRSVVDLLSAAGVDQSSILIQPGLERSWDYYTGIVFELRSGDQLLGGGGRYDELVRLLGAPVDVPAVGFALYLDTIAELARGAASP